MHLCYVPFPKHNLHASSRTVGRPAHETWHGVSHYRITVFVGTHTCSMGWSQTNVLPSHTQRNNCNLQWQKCGIKSTEGKESSRNKARECITVLWLRVPTWKSSADLIRSVTQTSGTFRVFILFMMLFQEQLVKNEAERERMQQRPDASFEQLMLRGLIIIWCAFRHNTTALYFHIWKYMAEAESEGKKICNSGHNFFFIILYVLPITPILFLFFFLLQSSSIIATRMQQKS